MLTVLPILRPTEPRVDTYQVVVETDATHTGSRPIQERRRLATWSPLQLVVAALGGFLIVLGAMVLVDTGVASWTESTATVWGFSHTPLMAVIDIVLGLLLLASSGGPSAARAALFGFGSLMAIFGAIVLLEPGVFGDVLGVNRQVGVFYASAGAGSVFLGGLIPAMR